MNDFTIFISSSDNYSDIWNVFFDMFKLFWPEYNGTIYLQTEQKTYSHEGLDIICTNIGTDKNFGAAFRKGLDKVQTDHVLLIMIDYLFMGKVNHRQLERYYNYFAKNDLDSLCLIHQNLPSTPCKDFPQISYSLPSNHTFSYQIAFWKKAMLKEMALPHENPWTSEWYGNKRAIKAQLDIRTINDTADPVFHYDLAGCLHLGKWLPKAVEFLKEHHYSIDFMPRGFYTNDYNTLRIRFTIKKNMLLHGLKGSFWYKIPINRKKSRKRFSY